MSKNKQLKNRKQRKKEVKNSLEKDYLFFMDNPWFTLTILIFVSLAVLFLENNNISFQQGHHGFLSSHGITLAKNISMENHLLMFHNISIDSQGTQIYNAYNRFPITSFLILKISMLPFENNLEMEVLAARYTMILFYLGSILLAYLTMQILFKNKLLAISVVLMAFSSVYIQYYNDMIFNDTPTLFGLFLVLHGMVVYNNDNSKFKQLLVKSIIGISLGWQVYTLLLLYIIYLMFRDFRSEGWGQSKKILSSNYFKLGLFTLIFGSVVLYAQLMNESKMTNQPLSKTNTVSSMKTRMGVNSEFDKKYANVLTFNKTVSMQFQRVMIMSTPTYIHQHFKKHIDSYFILLTLLFIMSTLVQYKGYKNEYNILIIFALSGFVWGFGMNHFTAFHDFQSIYYIGVPILIYGSIFSFIYNKFKQNNIALIILLFLSMLTFVNATYVFNLSKDQLSNRTNFITKDMQVIKDKVGEKNKICADGNVHKICGGQHACAFYLSGSYLQRSFDQAGCDFVISNNRKYNNRPLTQRNKGIFLFKYE